MPLAFPFFPFGCVDLTFQDEVTKNIPEIKKYKVGLLHLFIQHTSAGLTLNEYPQSRMSDLFVEIGIQMSGRI